MEATAQREAAAADAELERLRHELDSAMSSNQVAATTSQLVTSALSNKMADAASLQMQIVPLQEALEAAQQDIAERLQLELQQVRSFRFSS